MVRLAGLEVDSFLQASLPVENGAKAERSLMSSGFEYHRSGMKDSALL